MINWPSYNRSLIRRGEILFSYDFLDIWDSELERKNKNKKGKPFTFPDSFILVIGYVRIYIFSSALSSNRRLYHKSHWKEPSSSSICYSQICRRVVNQLDISSKRSQMMVMVITVMVEI